MKDIITNLFYLFKNRKGSAGTVIAAIIIAIAIIIAVYMYTSNQTHPFWEIK